jgi:hypothetical protein
MKQARETAVAERYRFMKKGESERERALSGLGCFAYLLW